MLATPKPRRPDAPVAGSLEELVPAQTRIPPGRSADRRSRGYRRATGRRRGPSDRWADGPHGRVDGEDRRKNRQPEGDSGARRGTPGPAAAIGIVGLERGRTIAVEGEEGVRGTSIVRLLDPPACSEASAGVGANRDG